jgi:hypothetical protein
MPLSHSKTLIHRHLLRQPTPLSPLWLSSASATTGSFFFLFSKGQANESSSISLYLCMESMAEMGQATEVFAWRPMHVCVAVADGLGGICGANNCIDHEGHALGGPVRALPHQPRHTLSLSLSLSLTHTHTHTHTHTST